MSVYFNLRHLWTPTGFKRFVHTRVPTGTNQAETHVKMRHLQHTRTPSANFWAVSQSESARNATQRRRFPRSEKPTADNTRRKPPRSSGPMAKSAPISCETAQNSQGRDHGQGRGSRKRRCGRASDIAGSCRRQGHSNRQRRQRMGLPPLLGRIPAQRVDTSPSAFCAYQ